MEHFKDIGIIVYIKLPYDDIKHRLGDLAKRGVSIKEGQTLRDLYNERLPLYEKYADIIADERGLTISQTAMYIKEQILSRYGGRKNDNKQG